MAGTKIRARKELRAWREDQDPKVTQDECGKVIGKTGALIRMFETGKVELIDEDCVKLSRWTSIPLASFLTRDRVRHIIEASRLLGERATA